MIETSVALQLIRDKTWHEDFQIVPVIRTHGTYNPAICGVSSSCPTICAAYPGDVGELNGYFSFEARKPGAKVVAFDFRHKDNSGIGLAQHINGMDDIEHHEINVLDLEGGTYGQHDVVLALGLLYHISDQYRALTNCVELSRERLLIECDRIEAIVSDDLRDQPVMRFTADIVRFLSNDQVSPD